MADKKKILSVTKSDYLRRVRQLALRKAGYSVASVKDFSEIETLSKSAAFDIAVVGHAFDPAVKRLVAGIIRKYFPDIPIVELTTKHADILGSVPSSPDSGELKATIEAVLGNRKTRKATSSN